MDSWISLQRANIVNEEQLTDDIFLTSLFGGPVFTILLAISALVLLKIFPNSIWILVFGLINSTFRILPTVIGALVAFKTDEQGISDEGNIILRILDSGLIRELTIILLLVFYVLLIRHFYKTFQLQPELSQKKPLFLTICLLTVLISLTYPKLDFLIFGV